MQNEKLKELIQWLEVNIKNLKRQKANNLYMEGVKQGMIKNADLILGKVRNIETDEKAFRFKDYIKDLQQKVEQLENIRKELTELQEEKERLNNIINEADTKNLELIQKINKIYDVIENKNITGIEARLLIQDMLDKEE